MISLLPVINKFNLLHLNFFLNCNRYNITPPLQLFLVFKVFTNFPGPLCLGYTCLRKLKIKIFMVYPCFLTHENPLPPRVIVDCSSHLVSSSILSSLQGLNFLLETYSDVPPRSLTCLPSSLPLFRSVESPNWCSIFYSVYLYIIVVCASQRGSLSIISSLQEQGWLRGLHIPATTFLADVPPRCSPCFPSLASLFRISEGLCWKTDNLQLLDEQQWQGFYN